MSLRRVFGLGGFGLGVFGLIGGLAACSPGRVRPLPAGATVPLQPAAESEVIYLVMVDRFANGDPSNDHLLQPDDPHGWHGGDIQGIRDQLDHLESLGVTTVWLTPVTAARDEKVGEWGAFHGYWMSDPTAMNPRFGTVADLRALSDDLHDRGMRLVADMVWNHTDYAAPIRQQHPEWFHHRGDIEDWNDPIQRVTGAVHGLPDLAQENPMVRAWLREAATAWVDRAGLDGLRVDAVGHMPRSFLVHMNRALDAHARARGNPTGIWTLAEDFTGDPLALAETVHESGFDAIFDFSLHYALVDVACKGADPLRLASTLSLDRHGPPASARVTFLDNHDLPRVASVCGTDPAGQARRDAALLLLFALRGTPCLTWGTEAGLEGLHEPGSRGDLPLDRLDHRSPLIATLAQLRKSRPALHSGTDRITAAGPGYLRLERRSGTDTAIVDVIGEHFDPASLPPLPPGLRADTVWWALSTPAGEPSTGLHSAMLSAPPRRPPPTPGPWTVRVTLGQTDPAEAELPSLQPHRLELRVSHAPERGTLRLVGSDPLLGGWRPSEGLAPVEGTDDRFSVVLRDGDVPTFKLVLLEPDGGVTWSDAPDQAVFLPPDLDMSTAKVDWSTAP